MGNIDVREQLVNDRKQGTFAEVQVPLERITVLHAFLLDFDRKHYRVGNPLFPPCDDPRMFFDAIRTVLGGRRSVTSDYERARPAISDLPVAVYGLTQRQADVLRLLIEGKPNKLICRDLALSEGTVKVHVSAILKALNVRTRAEVIVELSRRGILPGGAAPARTH